MFIGRDVRKDRAKLFAAVMIADGPDHRTLPAGNQRLHVAIGVEVVVIFNEVARHQQHGRLLPHRIQLIDYHVEPPDIELVRITPVKTDVQIRHLGNQDAVNRWSFCQLTLPREPLACDSETPIVQPLTDPSYAFPCPQRHHRRQMKGRSQGESCASIVLRWLLERVRKPSS